MSTIIICSICLEDLNKSESEAVALGCGHVFDRTWQVHNIAWSKLLG